MPTFWELVTANSTAPAGSTLWEHLNAQTGGSSGGGTVVVAAMVAEPVRVTNATLEQVITSFNFRPAYRAVVAEVSPKELRALLTSNLKVTQV